MAATDPELGALVERSIAAMSKGGPYRPPTEDEVASLLALAATLAALGPPDRAADDLRGVGRPLGLTATPVRDGGLVLASDSVDERSWMLLAVRPGTVPTVLVEVPHPLADLHTEHVGVAMMRELPGALYLQAGAHRVAGAPLDATDRTACPADVAARPDAAFARLAESLVGRLGIPQVQVHGFADRRDRPVDVVVSSGPAATGPLCTAIVDGVRARGERVATGDDPALQDLAGRRNVQGRSALRHRAVFVHVELSRALRQDPTRASGVATALAHAIASVIPSGPVSGRRVQAERRR